MALFGPTRVHRSGGTIDHSALGGVKPRQVLEILAVAAGSPVPKDRLAEMLWDGHPPRSYAGTLESYVCLVRRALGLSGRHSGIGTVMHGYLLDPDRLTVDLVEFRRLAGGAGVRCDDARLAEVERAVTLADGTLLASDEYAAWAVSEREVVARQLASAAVEGAGCALRLGRPDTAVRLARVAVAQDSFDEAACRVLITALDAAGRRPEAIRAYLALERSLSQELATVPSPSTTRCYLAVLGRSDGPGEGRGGARELRLLLDLVRERVHAVAGVDVPAADVCLGGLAAAIPSAG